MDSTNIYFKIQKASILYKQSKYGEALDLFKQIYSHSNSSTALKQIAQCYDKMNLLDSAKVYFKEAWDRNPEDAFSVANLTNICLKQGSFQVYEGMAYSDKYIESDSTDQQINLLNALSYYKVDDYERAIERFRKCYLNGDSSLVVNRSLGICYYSMNDSYLAQPFLESAHRQDSTNNNVLYCLAIACNDMGEHAKAIPYFRTLLDRTIPSDLTLFLYYKNLASAYVKGSYHQKAMDTYAEALKYGDNNQNMNIYFTMGNIYEYSLQDDKKALESFQLYKVALNGYIDSLREKEEIDGREIKATEEKLVHLNTYIARLEKDIAEGRKSTNLPPMVIRTP